MEITGTLVKITNVLNGLSIPYAVTGGVAVTVWGRARYTADIDIIIDISPQNLRPLVSALLKTDSKMYLDIDVETPITEIKKRGGFNLVYSQNGVKVDFVIKKDDEFFQMELKRVVKKDFHNQKISFISPEDLILIKLQWYKDSGSTRHLEDAESILKITDVDLEYIKDWSHRHETREILEKLLEKIKND